MGFGVRGSTGGGRGVKNMSVSDSGKYGEGGHQLAMNKNIDAATKEFNKHRESTPIALNPFTPGNMYMYDKKK